MDLISIVPTDELIVNKYDVSGIEGIRPINLELFNEERVINHYHHPDILVYEATINGMVVGFKVGYGKPKGIYYSAKGGVLPQYRRNGIATLLLDKMMLEAWKRGYHTFCYDTFPNQHKGMLILGLNKNFVITSAGWNKVHNDYHIRLEKDLKKHFK